MSETSAVRALLGIETLDAELLFTQAPDSDALLWPLARMPIANALASAQLNVTAHAQLAQQDNRLYYLKRAIRERIPNPRSSDRLLNPVEHLFFVSGKTMNSSARGLENWLCDAFALALGNSAAVVQVHEYDSLTPRSERPANRRTWTWAPAAARIRDAAKAKPLAEPANELISWFLEEVFSRLGDILPASAHERITQEVIGWVTQLQHADREFEALLDRTRPKRIYMEDASYGHYSNFIRLAHEREIEVVELQHGWIGSSHAAYNYGEAWFDTSLTRSLPRTLATFGGYWASELRYPGKTVAVGKPLLERAVAAASRYTERKHRALVVSSVYERERLIAAARSLRHTLPPSWEIALRPHPTERNDAEVLFAEALADGVVLDQEQDVNSSVAASRAVIGMVSTVLFEALPLGVHIGVIETGLAEFYADSQVFPHRLHNEVSFADFATMLTSTTAPEMQARQYIWHPDPVPTFLEKFA